MKKVLFISLGCDKNLVDSEVMLGLLNDRGYIITDNEEDADVVVINTCCFIHDAKEESIENILEIAELKKKGSISKLIVTGCMAERYREEVLEEIPEVDGVLGTNSYDKIVEAIEESGDGKRSLYMSELRGFPQEETNPLVTTGGHYAYLKIAEGCDKHCTYCIIPSLRGAYRSIPMEKVIKRAEYLVEGGVKELILVAQETTVYGKDIYNDKYLPQLLKELCEIEELQWIRILYSYPEEINEELIQTIKSEKKICHYLDLPIQHCNDRILRRMGRRTSKEDIVSLITNLRENVPDICLRTSLITGFPGETEEEHDELKAFVKEIGFDRLGVFTYSQEENTPAADMEDQIEEEVKQRRRDEIMEIQHEIVCQKSEDRIDETYLVMIEGYIPEDNIYIGRTYMDAPKVDGYMFVHSEDVLNSGDFVWGKVTEALEYDLIGEKVDEFTK